MAEDTKDSTQTNTTPDTEKVAVPPKKKNNKTLWIVIGVIVVFFLVIPVLLAIGGSILKDKLDDPTTGEQIAESLIENATGADVNVDSKDGSYTVESKDGSESFSVGDNQKLPEDFPKDVSQYLPEKKVVFVLTSDNEGKKTWSVTTIVDKSFEETVKHFEDTINSTDYTDTSSFGFGESKTFYGKKDGKSVSVTVSKAEDSGDVSVSYIVSEEY